MESAVYMVYMGPFLFEFENLVTLHCFSSPSYTHVFQELSTNCNEYIIIDKCYFLVGTEDEYLVNILMSPNPVQDYLQLSNLPPRSSIRLVNITGVVILELDLLNERANIDVADVQRGAYFVQVLSDHKLVWSKPLIINR